MSAPRLRPFTATKVLIIIDSYSSTVDSIQTGEMDHEIPALTIYQISKFVNLEENWVEWKALEEASDAQHQVFPAFDDGQADKWMAEVVLNKFRKWPAASQQDDSDH